LKKPKWMCEKVIRRFHLVSDSEIKLQLAELWNILIASKLVDKVESDKEMQTAIIKKVVHHLIRT